jgi:hypothetical protein
LDVVAIKENIVGRVVATENTEGIISGDPECLGPAKDRQGPGNRAQERVGDASVFADAVVGGTFIITKGDVEACGLPRIDEERGKG